MRLAIFAVSLPRGARTMLHPRYRINNANVMIPILVTGPGRSGTTLLMGVLASLPQVSVAELIPYEVKLLAYYATAYRTLTAPADHPRSMHPDRLRRDEVSVGFNPFNNSIFNSVFNERGIVDDFFENFVPEKIRRAFADIIVEYYSRLAKDQGKVAPRYFAEKSNDIAPWPRTFARAAFPSIKEVVLFRDPRDLYCSRKAFFRYDTVRAMAEVTHTCRTLADILDHGGTDLLAVSYESLILQPAQSLGMLSIFLDIPVRMLDPDAQRGLFTGHGTSGTPRASIGRWKVDMTKQEKSAAQEAWQEFLVRFGYDQEDGPSPETEPSDRKGK